jgi:hypothetical protein
MFMPREPEFNWNQRVLKRTSQASQCNGHALRSSAGDRVETLSSAARGEEELKNEQFRGSFVSFWVDLTLPSARCWRPPCN